ncbi:hypothetical protein JK358_04275 [Nocardia sp. 2]|uniref:Uncharacterized protein n=1 Tax=Nocardia acididurans TaxID=2802282 RepID=A0ABS1LZB7_9NOCA|nr:hypothetical protein [Nocardia acididurans]MBL1073601.1 hypothetical protein [Nocardia acididurans]
MATKKVTISIDEDTDRLLRAAAALAGMDYSPYVVRCARNWALHEDALRAAVRDSARDDETAAREQLADQQAAEAAAARDHRGHAA